MLISPLVVDHCRYRDIAFRSIGKKTSVEAGATGMALINGLFFALC